MSRSGIEYVDETWNPTTGCTPVSAGCRNCWAAAMAKRFPRLHTTSNGRYSGPGELLLPKFSDVLLHPDRLDAPLRWRKPRVVGVCFMGDLFHEAVDSRFIGDVFAMMRRTPRHTYLILTKRPKYMRDFCQGWPGALDTVDVDGSTLAQGWPLPNVYLGVSVEDQATADERIPILLQTPAAHRWVSVEPMLGPVNLTPYIGANTYRCSCGWHDTENEMQFLGGALKPRFQCQECGETSERFPPIEWVIAGCESINGRSGRPADNNWFASLKRQCVSASVPFFLKQWVEMDGMFHTRPRVVKLPELDGRRWEERPW